MGKPNIPLAILVLGSACASAPKGRGDRERPAELVLRGGVIHTLATPEQASAVAIAQGRILEVGSDQDIASRIGPDTKVVELEGRVVVPGLVDSHMHLFNLGRKAAGVDLIGLSSLEAAQAKVKTAVEAAAAGTWIRGRGWDQNDWPEFLASGRRFPSAADLDLVAPNHPVVLTRIDGHAVWASSQALKAAGIDAKTPDPEGGKIERDAKGAPTGVLVDNAMDLLRSKMPDLSREEKQRALLAGQEACLAAGLTQVHDMGLSPEAISMLEELDKSGALELRVYGYVDGSVKSLPSILDRGPIEGRRLTVRGVKLFADGALGSRGAALLAPYSDDPKNEGLLVTAPAELRRLTALAKEHGFQVATHAIGDRANREVLDTYQAVFGDDDGRYRPRVEHAQVVNLDDIARFQKQGVIASMQPTHATSDMPWAEARVGPERIQGAYAWKTLLDSGAHFAAGSDAPVELISPFAGLYAAITRQDPSGQPEGGWRAQERLSRREALEAFTAGAAYASFREDEAGRIEAGKVADLTVLDRDPMTVEPRAIYDTEVVWVLVEGRIVWTAPRAE